MKTGIILGVILGLGILAIAALAVVMLVVLPVSRQTSAEPFSTTATPNIVIASTSVPVAAATSGITPITPTDSLPPGNPGANFILNVSDFTVNDFSANITALFTNQGSDDAHNVQAQVQATSEGSAVKINGNDVFVIALGTIKAQQTISAKTTLSFNLLDGLKVTNSGATFNLLLISNEKTQGFSYYYRP
jgi:hypothetical protein